MEPYHPIETDESRYSSRYSVLVGPNNFETYLGEPEDCTWERDGSKVVNELNRLHKELKELKEWAIDAQRRLDSWEEWSKKEMEKLRRKLGY